MRTRRQRGGFWPFTSGEEKTTEEPVMNTAEKKEDKEEGGFFAGLFGTSKPNASATDSTSVMDLPEIEPQGPVLSEEVQAGGAKKRRSRTLRKRRSIRKSHKKSRKSRKSRKSQKKH